MLDWLHAVPDEYQYYSKQWSYMTACRLLSQGISDFFQYLLFLIKDSIKARISTKNDCRPCILGFSELPSPVGTLLEHIGLVGKPDHEVPAMKVHLSNPVSVSFMNSVATQPRLAGYLA